MRLKVAMMAASIMIAAATMQAGTIHYNFSQGYIGAQGPQLTYTSGGYSITANGYDVNFFYPLFGPPTFPANLYVKTSGGDESGLGLEYSNDHEIGSLEFVQLDLTNLANAGITSGDLTIGSVQHGEGYSICTANTLGLLGSCSLDGTLDETPFAVNWSASDPILGITAYIPPGGSSGANVLVMDLSTSTTQSPTPEPASLALMGTGLIALGLACRRYTRHALAKQ